MPCGCWIGSCLLAWETGVVESTGAIAVIGFGVLERPNGFLLPALLLELELTICVDLPLGEDVSSDAGWKGKYGLAV